MAYLIVRDDSTCCVEAIPHAAKEPQAERIRKVIKELYPKFRVVSPLEKCDPARTTRLSVYVSKNQDGNGRIGSSVQPWAIEAPKGKP